MGGGQRGVGGARQGDLNRFVRLVNHIALHPDRDRSGRITDRDGEAQRVGRRVVRTGGGRTAQSVGNRHRLGAFLAKRHCEGHISGRGRVVTLRNRRRVSYRHRGTIIINDRHRCFSFIFETQFKTYCPERQNLVGLVLTVIDRDQFKCARTAQLSRGNSDVKMSYPIPLLIELMEDSRVHAVIQPKLRGVSWKAHKHYHILILSESAGTRQSDGHRHRHRLAHTFRHRRRICSHRETRRGGVVIGDGPRTNNRPLCLRQVGVGGLGQGHYDRFLRLVNHIALDGNNDRTGF